MNISLENYLRNKLDQNESMHDYSVATDCVRFWIEEYNMQYKLKNNKICNH